MKMQSYLGQARALGSSKNGVHHWWHQRLSAIALVPLALWFVFSIIGLAGADYAAYKEWLGDHGNVVFLCLFIFTMFYHAVLGLQVVVEDYVSCEAKKVFLLVFVKLIAALMGFASITAVLRVAFGG